MPADERPAVIAQVASALPLAAGEPLLPASGGTHDGVGPLLEACWQAVGKDEGRPGWGDPVTG